MLGLYQKTSLNWLSIFIRERPGDTMTMRHMTTTLALLAMLMLLAAGGLRAQSPERVISGKIIDAHKVGMAGVQVKLQKAGVETQTAADGSYKLTVRATTMPGADGVLDVLELNKPGRLAKWIQVTEAAYQQPLNVTDESPEIGVDDVGFIDFMPLAGVFIKRLAQIKADPPYTVTAEQLRTGLEQIASEARTARANADAAFYAWVPPGAKPLKAAFLISLHGNGSIDAPVLRRFATQHDVALVGVFGDPIQRGCYPLELMDKHLARLGQMVGHPELVTVPVLTFGHSNGTGFATVYASDRADRLIGWISYHSGYAWQNLMPGLEKVPGLVMHGQLDKFLDQYSQDVGVQVMRKQSNAPVAMMLEGNVAHGPVDRDATWEFVVQFCEAAMRIRLGENGQLKPVVIEQGWLGGIYDRAKAGQQLLPIAPTAQYPGNKTTASWLPDETFAKVWQTYGNTDPRKAGK